MYGCKGVKYFSPLRVLLDNLESLKCGGCGFNDLPEEVCGHTLGANDVEGVRAYFEDHPNGSETDPNTPRPIPSLGAPVPVPGSPTDATKEPPVIPVPVPRTEAAEKIVAISYAWGDDKSIAGRERGRIVEELQPRLAAWGYTIRRDRDQLRNCDLISDFMQTIGGARRVIVILSEKYLRSVFCMSELHYVYQTSRGKKKDFTDRIVPLLLDGVQIDTWRDRSRWRDHWLKEYEEMSKAAGSLSTEDFDLYRRISIWYNAVADMLGFIADMVTVRGAEAIAADDFRAVREMLERRATL
jgi:internalin A